VTAARTTHRLEGLEPDNLLAFLALLGLLRALEAAGWRPRAHWEGPPLRPVLSLPEAATEAEVAEAAAKGCAALAVDYDFNGREKLNYTADEFRSFCLELNAVSRSAWLRRQDIMAPLAHEAVAKPGQPSNGSASLERSPFNCLDVAQVKFLRSLKEATHIRSNLEVVADQIAQALFAPWRRGDRFTTFRWDPLEDRRHAYRATAPTSDPVKTEAGAIRLAAFGLSLMPGAAIRQRGRLRFMVLGSRRNMAGDIEITWPIWDMPMSRAALQALLGHPALAGDAPDISVLRGLSVIGAFRTRKIASREYGNFTRAERV